jgi:hypothetical protein
MAGMTGGKRGRGQVDPILHSLTCKTQLQNAIEL